MVFFWLFVSLVGRLRSPLQTLRVFLNFSSRVAPPIRLDVSAQFFRDGKLLELHSVSDSSHVFAHHFEYSFVLLNNTL